MVARASAAASLQTSLPLDTVIQDDCIKAMAQLPDKSVDLIFADPPYNLQLQNELWRPNMTLVDAVDDDWDKFDSFEAYDNFSRRWLAECRRVLKDSGTIWVIGSYHNIYRLGTVMMDLGFWILNDVVYVKLNPMPNFRGVRFTNAHETLLWCKKSKSQKKYTFNYQQMKQLNDDKQMRSDWEIALCTGSERLRINGEKLHNTQKPEALLYRVILSSSNPGDVVLDPFFGTGTTGAVAKKLHRHWIGIERNPVYAAAARERIENIQQMTLDLQVFPVQSKRTQPRVAFSALIESGLIAPGAKLYYARPGREKDIVIAEDGAANVPVALVRADSSLKCGEHEGSIHGVGSKVGNAPACNGWEHWWYQDENATLQSIDRLREEFRKRAALEQA
ncbi:MAG TPA: DNA methyltransferase [Chloroflexia bacterium]|nr:DNA methyltransferase [Chloroflexia bacterium]